jgi:hypothetical protein
MKDLATEAIRCAESENQDILEGNPVEEPTPLEDLIAHWRTHRRPMQSRTYKSMVPQERRQLLEDHLLATEYLMVEKASTNMKFAMLLEAEPEFPCLFVMQQQPMGMPGAPMGPMGPVMPEGTPNPLSEEMALEPMALDAQDPTAPPLPVEEAPAEL